MQDEFYMARALKLAQRDVSPLTRTLMSAVSLLTMAISSAKVITIAPESRMPSVHALRMAGAKAKGATAQCVTLEPRTSWANAAML